MPPVNQGSRAALVTWTIVTSFLFVIATIFAIYFYVEATRVADLNKTLSSKYGTIIAEGALTSPEVAAIDAARNKEENGYDKGAGLFFVAVQRGDRLAKLITGTSNQLPETARTAGAAALGAVSKKVEAVGLKVQSDNLVGALNLLSDAVVQRSNQAANARKQADDSAAALQQVQKDTAGQIKLLTDQLAAVRADQDQATKNVETITQQKDALVQDTAASTNVSLKETQDALNKANVQIAELKQRLQTNKQEADKVQQKLAEIRPDVNKPVLRQADGQIVRLPGGKICFIDLGAGDQIIPGMAFEVYDRNEGIPAPGDPTTDIGLPKGKASLEVTRVGATSSECRIVSTAVHSALTEGDLIANLVYDRNTKNKFLVYGTFDLDRDGHATIQDGEVIKRLVTQWGAEVVPDVNVDTDFVVLGQEPVLPTLTKEEREDPIQKAIYDKAVAEAEAYSNVSSKARDYRIPILNQNRFLYMVGFFESSKR